MIFKDIRYYIFSNLELVIGDEHILNVDKYDENIDQYDRYEVIGIRSSFNKEDFAIVKDIDFIDSRIIISLKKRKGITKSSDISPIIKDQEQEIATGKGE